MTPDGRIKRMREYAGEIAVGVSVVAFSGMGILLVDVGKHMAEFNSHVVAPAHAVQMTENKVAQKSVGEVKQNVARLEEKIESVDEKIEKAADDSKAFRAEQRGVNNEILRALGRLETGGTE